MADTATRTIKIGDQIIPVTEPVPIPIAIPDVMIESREWNGLLCVSFAALVKDGDALVEARVCSRLRIPLNAAMWMRDVLDNLLKQAMPGKEKAN